MRMLESVCALTECNTNVLFLNNIDRTENPELFFVFVFASRAAWLSRVKCFINCAYRKFRCKEPWCHLGCICKHKLDEVFDGFRQSDFVLETKFR